MDSREPREDHELAAENRYLIVKRGLYFRPNDHGYTGLKREAGRYPASHADAGSGETAIHEDEAPEYSPACWEETKLADKDRQIAELQAALRRPSPVAESTPTDATAVEAGRDGDKCACFCPTDECQRVCTLDCPNAGARTPKES